ncbi:MAG: O-antigen ligase family protein [Bacteroidota bacterium]|nr:O-antigen ligase family protein [Bacteroidota bacterium]
MNIVTSKYNNKIITWIIALIAASFLLSLVVLQVLTAILFFLWLSESFESKKKAFGKIEIAFTIFAFFRLFSVAISSFPELSIHSLYKDALFYLSLYAFSFYIKVLSIENLKKILSTFFNASVIVALIGIVIFNLGIKDRATSIVSGYATFSTFLLTSVAISFFSYDKDSLEKNKYFWAVRVGLILTAIVVALGRADLGIAVLVFIAGSIFFRPSIVQIVIALAIVFSLSFISFKNNSSQLAHRIEKPATMSDRDVLWGTVFERAHEHPFFGFGPRTFKGVFNHTDQLGDKEVGGWHNDYLVIYIESGVFALLSYLSLIAIIYFMSAKKLLGKESNCSDKNTIFVFLLAVSGMFLSSFLSGVIADPINSIVLSFVLSGLSAYVFKADLAKKTLEEQTA